MRPGKKKNAADRETRKLEKKKEKRKWNHGEGCDFSIGDKAEEYGGSGGGQRTVTRLHHKEKK